jgi:hypothetical protein
MAFHLLYCIVTIIIIPIKYVLLYMQILFTRLPVSAVQTWGNDVIDHHGDTIRKTSMTLELIQRPNSWTQFGQKSFLPCYLHSPLLTDFDPPPFETFLWSKHCKRKPQVWELSRLCPETSTKLYVHEFGFSSESRIRQVYLENFFPKFAVANLKKSVSMSIFKNR